MTAKSNLISSVKIKNIHTTRLKKIGDKLVNNSITSDTI